MLGSRFGDTAPVLTLNLGTVKDVNQVGVHSGYGYPNVATGTVMAAFRVEAHTAAGRVQPGSVTGTPRPLVSIPGTTPDIARVYEVAAH